MSQHNVWHGDGGVRSARHYITAQELASSSRLLTAGSEGWEQPRQLRGMLCTSTGCTACPGNEWAREARKERRKHCSENKWDICAQVCKPAWCQRPLVLREIYSSKGLAREKKKSVFPLASWSSVTGVHYLMRVIRQGPRQDCGMVVGNRNSLPVLQGLQTLKGFRQETDGVSFVFYCSLYL